MIASSRLHRLTAWLALWCLVLNALVPLAAQAAVAVRSVEPPLELCTATGMVLVQRLDDQSSEDVIKLPLSCPWCLTHGGTHALPVKVVSAPVIQPFYMAPVGPHVHVPVVWPAPHSRAPPNA